MSTILLADDDQLLRLILRERLERDGHEVFECGDGFAALEIAMQERPEFLVLDVMMPLARGLEVVRQVRREDGWRPGIVMVSARTRVTDRLNALDAGADIYLEKPIAPNALVEAIARLGEDSTPTRIVDLLGPVWATLALDRLVRRTPPTPRVHEITSHFARQMRDVLGVAAAGADAQALRVLWEHSLRQLLGDVTDPEIPIVTDVRVPAAGLPPWAGWTGGVEPDEWRVKMWRRRLAQVLASPTLEGTDAHLERHVATALQHVLGIHRGGGDRWTTALAHVLGHAQTARRSPAETLELGISGALGDVLGIHTVECDRWSHTLARVLAHHSHDSALGARRIERQIGSALDDALASGDGTLGRATERERTLWASAMDEILRGPDGPIVIPDVRRALDEIAVGHPTGTRG